MTREPSSKDESAATSSPLTSREPAIPGSSDGGPPAERNPGRASEADREDKAARHRLRNGLISLAILGALVIGLLSSVSGLHSIAHAVTRISLPTLFICIGLEMLSCIGYVVAFLEVFPRAPIRFGARVALTELAFGAAVPVGGAGSAAIGVWLLVERGRDPKTTAERSAMLFLLTSAVNVVTLAATGIGLWLGILSGPRDPLLSLLPGAVGVVTFVFFLFLPAIMGRLAASRSPGKLRTLLDSAATTVIGTRKLVFSLDWRNLGALGFLWFDIAVFVLCVDAAVGHAVPIAELVLAYQIGYLSSLIPVPGGLGVVDGSFVGLLVLYGVHATSATAGTIVYRGISLWVPALWGTAAFLILQRTRGQPLTLREPPARR